MRALLAMLAVVNPAAVALTLGRPERRTLMAAAVTAAWVIVVVGAAGSEAVRDALDVSRETFRVAAALVIGLAGARWLVVGANRVDDVGAGDGWTRVGVPLLIPVLLTPQLAMAAVSLGSDHGVMVTAATAAAGLALAWVAATIRARPALLHTGARFAGALAIAVAVTLAVDGIQDV